MKRTRIFPGNEEVFNLLFPLFFIIAALGEILFFKNFFDRHAKDVLMLMLMLMALYLFLNSEKCKNILSAVARKP